MKRKHTLYLKFIIVYLIFGILAFITIATVTSSLTEKYLIKEKAASLYKEATLISSRYAKYFIINSPDEEIIDRLDEISSATSCPIWIVNQNGYVLYDSEKKITPESSFCIENFNPADMGNDFYITGSFYGQFEENTLSVLSPITFNFKPQGYVILYYPINDIQSSKNELLNISYITLIIIFILSSIILIAFTTMVYLPLRTITKGSMEYSEGNLKHVIEVNKEDEIGFLANSLNLMAGELSRSEENQKKFIANISHDFRSPLTSIRGYLEAMVDGTIPPEMHEKYLKIVLNETSRLTKLTGSLLTLNNLGGKGILLDVTKFDINRVIKNTAATFEGTCKSKSIRLNLILSGQSLYVSADKAKIEQVLYNLIDNAIKFSHTNSVIHVETTEKNETVFVSVKDSGIGIPKESLKLIFDRFYKTDLSRGKDKKGTGLGLSIVKEIINAHHEKINVISTVGVGTEFIFTLPKAE